MSDVIMQWVILIWLLKLFSWIKNGLNWISFLLSCCENCAFFLDHIYIGTWNILLSWCCVNFFLFWDFLRMEGCDHWIEYNPLWITLLLHEVSLSSNWAWFSHCLLHGIRDIALCPVSFCPDRSLTTTLLMSNLVESYS